MLHNNGDGYQTLGWIINESKSGLYIVVADEKMQCEIADVYRQGIVGIYDCRVHPGAYSYQKLKEKIETWDEKQVIFVVNFQFAIQSEEDLRKLNFSRDMLAGLNKNIIFMTTIYGDDMLSRGAYDFYSFVKMRILFSDHEENKNDNLTDILSENNENLSKEWDADEIKDKIEDSYGLVLEAKEKLQETNYEGCIRLLTQAKSIRERILGCQHVETAEIYLELAHAHFKQGKYKEAERLCRKSLEIKRAILGEEHPQTISCCQELADIYVHLDKYKDAEEIYFKVMNAGKNIWEEEHPQMAACYGGLAQLYAKLGRYGEAIDMFQRALEICEIIYGEWNENTAANCVNLGKIYVELERFEETEELCNRALVIRDKVFESKHPDLAYGYVEIADIWMKMGQDKIAEELYTKALNLYKEILGEETPEILTCYTSLGQVFVRQEKYENAENMYEIAIRILDTSEGRRVRRLWTYYRMLTEVYIKEKKDCEEEIGKIIAALEKNKLEKRHPDMAIICDNLGTIYVEQNRCDEAENWYKKAFEISKEILGDKHKNTIHALEGLKYVRQRKE